MSTFVLTQLWEDDRHGNVTETMIVADDVREPRVRPRGNGPGRMFGERVAYTVDNMGIGLRTVT